MIEDERPPQGSGLWKRFLLAGGLIAAISGAATATVALNTVSGIAGEVFPKLNQIDAPKGVVTPVYSGGAQTFLVLGSDRRALSKIAVDRSGPPHSDTMLLVRFDPEQEQTSVLSIPRDLLVDITAPNGQVYAGEKINAAYTIGSKLGGTDGGARLAAETLEHEMPGLQLNGIVDVTFKGFIDVVDTLGCVYVNVDHRYHHTSEATSESNYSSINLQPGYQKLCYENALSYVRYRHTDSDFVRVARQQDFLRDLREQISPENVLGQIDTVAKAVGHAISSSFHASAGQLLELAKLVLFSQGKPLRQVKFRVADANYQLKGASYVTSTPELIQATLNDFLHGAQRPKLSSTTTTGRTARGHSGHGGAHASGSSSPSRAPRPDGVVGLYPASSSAGRGEASAARGALPFPVLYPTLQTGPAVQQQVRAYGLRDPGGHLHHAYIVVWQQNGLGGYYDFEGTDWLDPPLVAHPDQTRRIGGRSYMIFADGSHIHTIAWREHGALYWVVNTLLEDLSNEQLLGLARSAQPLR
jgi:polyisoprenyl-teichoic acid--peptidoglycan teichoic acid transferase